MKKLLLFLFVSIIYVIVSFMLIKAYPHLAIYVLNILNIILLILLFKRKKDDKRFRKIDRCSF